MSKILGICSAVTNGLELFLTQIRILIGSSCN